MLADYAYHCMQDRVRQLEAEAAEHEVQSARKMAQLHMAHIAWYALNPLALQYLDASLSYMKLQKQSPLVVSGHHDTVTC